jgi:multiple sugar transport system ATP-binding protein
VSGKVTMLEPTGADTIVWTALGGQPLTIRVDAEKHYHLGDTIDFAIDLDRASLFDTASGERL